MGIGSILRGAARAVGHGAAITIKGVLTGVSNVVKSLLGKANEITVSGGDLVRIDVGYSAEYAVYVHESVGMKLAGIPRSSGIGVYWGKPNQLGQAKFLEEPARKMRKEIRDFVVSQLKKGVPLDKALHRAGTRILEASKKLVPVEYGELKASGYVRVNGVDGGEESGLSTRTMWD